MKVLPNVIVIGAMKCGTTALHRYLDHHPDIAMSTPKELNFFIGDPHDDGRSNLVGGYGRGTWHRGLQWYVQRFNELALVRGESSPGYTSPDHAEVAERMVQVLPHAWLIYLVRDPIARAVSQYRHHVAEGTEPRPLHEALLDESSQYVARSRYHQRLVPFLERFAHRQIAVIPAEELGERRRPTLQRLFRFVGVDDGFWCECLRRQWHTRVGAVPELDPALQERLVEVFRDDVARLRRATGLGFAGWSV